MQKQEKNKEDLGIKLGSPEMVFWRNTLEANKINIKTTEENLKFYKFIDKYASLEMEKAEKEFGK